MINNNEPLLINEQYNNKDKEKLKTDLYETIHNISILLSKAVPLELRNSQNDRSKQLKDLLNTWIKDSSSKKQAYRPKVEYDLVVPKKILIRVTDH